MSESLQLVTFRIGNEEFAIDIKKVREINRMIDITQIPNAPPFVKGMVNLRGKIIPVVSLRKKLGFDEIECGNATRIMVAEIENQILGFIVDSVSEVLRIQNADVEAAPSIGGGDTPYIEGVLNLPSRILILLDLTKLFNEDTRVAA